MSTLKGFHDYTDRELKQTLENGVYHLRVAKAEVGEWPSGDPNLNITTVVASGERKGQFGPRHTWSITDFVGVNGKTGESFTIEAEKSYMDLIRDTRAIRNGQEIVLSQPDMVDVAMLTEIAKQIEGDEFYAVVGENKTGWNIAKKFISLSEPPKGVDGASGFVNLDDV